MKFPAPIIVDAKLFGREPPHSAEAEMSLIGSMLIDPRCIPEVAETVTADDFYNPAHGMVFSAALDVFRKHGDGDLVQLQNRLREAGNYDTVGGDAKLVELVEATPSAVNYPHYMRIVADRAAGRRMIETCGRAVFDLQHSEDFPATIDGIQRDVMAAVKGGRASRAFTTTEITDAIVNRWEAGIPEDFEVPTPWDVLNAKIGGLVRGVFYVIGARPSHGKTTWAMQAARHMGQHYPVVFYSLEMGREALIAREIAAETGADFRAVMRGACNMERAVPAIGRLNLNKLLIIDNIPRRWATIQASMHRMHAQVKPRAYFIDYAQLMGHTDKRHLELSDIAGEMQGIAKKLDASVVLLSQINRGAVQTLASRPALKDLKESGGIEEAADVAILLHRESYYHEGDEQWSAENPDKVNTAEMIVAKQRNGPTGVVRVGWNGARFTNERGV